ncbi:MAG: hypothetical protein WA364_09425 [Candidatus Nitrosopolaris sp.]
MKGKTITATTTSLSTLIHIVTALMLSTAVIYFVVASQSYSELSQLTSQSSIDKALSDITSTRNEMIFFTIVGITYILVGFWMIKRKYHSKTPYIIAITGSAALIVFYIATRTVSLPTVGLETDIGIIDLVSKILQGSIIVGSLFVLRLSAQSQHVQY